MRYMRPGKSGLAGGFWWCEEVSIFKRKRSTFAPPLQGFRKYWGGFRPIKHWLVKK